MLYKLRRNYNYVKSGRLITGQMYNYVKKNTYIKMCDG